MSRISVGYSEVDSFVSDQRASGSDVYWDGWTMVFWRPNKNGYGDRCGSFRNGRWGVQARVDVESDGTYRIPTKYVATSRRGK